MTDIFKESKRIHDEFYLKEKLLVKDSFKYLLNKISEDIENKITAIDIGCATGIFLSYFKNQFPNIDVFGADVKENLLSQARKNCPDGVFYNFDICDQKSINKAINKKRFDVVILDGVHPIFDVVEDWIKNLVNLVSNDGIIYIFGSFNDKDYDVITRVKHIDSNIWEKGWNRISLKTIEREFKKYNFKVTFNKFEININLDERRDDPRRTYTKNLEDGSKLTRNGLELISTPYLIKCIKIK